MSKRTWYLLLLAGCASTPSPYTRLTADDGLVYYARMDYAFESPTGGFLTFRDLVTKEDVRLKNGAYTLLIEKPGYLTQKFGPVDVTQKDMNVGDIAIWKA